MDYLVLTWTALCRKIELGRNMLVRYTVKEIDTKWNMTTRWVQVLCNQGRIPGAVKFGRDWAIPIDAEKPKDGRQTTGEYKNWRKKRKK